MSNLCAIGDCWGGLLHDSLFASEILGQSVRLDCSARGHDSKVALVVTYRGMVNITLFTLSLHLTPDRD